MSDSKKLKWTKPKVMRFESEQDVRLYFYGKGTPEQCEALDKMIEDARPPENRAIKRRA